MIVFKALLYGFFLELKTPKPIHYYNIVPNPISSEEAINAAGRLEKEYYRRVRLDMIIFLLIKISYPKKKRPGVDFHPFLFITPLLVLCVCESPQL